MSELLLELIKIVEGRFGALGGILANILLACAFLWIVMSTAQKSYEVAISPFIQSLRGPYSDEVLWHASKVIMLIVLLAVAFFFSYYIIGPQMTKRSRSILENVEQTQEKTTELLIRAKEEVEELEKLDAHVAEEIKEYRKLRSGVDRQLARVQAIVEELESGPRSHQGSDAEMPDSTTG